MDQKAIVGLLRLQAEAEEVAVHLEDLAKQVRAGNLIGFEVKWLAGNEELESKLMPRTPQKTVPLTLKCEGDHEKDDSVRRDGDRPGRVVRRK
jgi:hypothetical protein